MMGVLDSNKNKYKYSKEDFTRTFQVLNDEQSFRWKDYKIIKYWLKLSEAGQIEVLNSFAPGEVNEIVKNADIRNLRELERIRQKYLITGCLTKDELKTIDLLGISKDNECATTENTVQDNIQKSILNIMNYIEANGGFSKIAK